MEFECNKTCKFDEYLRSKNCSCKKRLFRKLVLECEDEKLNTIDTNKNYKKANCKKSNCLIHRISLIIIYLLLLVVICVTCYF